MIEVGACRPDELPDVVALATRVFRPPGSPPSAMADAYPLLFAGENVGHLRVVRTHGSIVAFAGLLLRELRAGNAAVTIGLVGAVCTAPGHEGRGYASRALEDVWSVARQSGAALLLVSGRRGLYTRLGCEPLAPALRVHVPAAAARTLALRPVPPMAPSAEELNALQALHEREAVRLVRPPAVWRRLLAARTAFWRHGGVTLVANGGAPTPSAYLASEAEPVVRDGTSTLRVVEAVGERRAALLGAAALASAVGASRAELIASRYDEALGEAALALGLSLGSLDLPFSVAYLNAASRSLALPGYGLDYI